MKSRIGRYNQAYAYGMSLSLKFTARIQISPGRLREKQLSRQPILANVIRTCAREARAIPFAPFLPAGEQHHQPGVDTLLGSEHEDLQAPH
jgi:hypothetical protein